MKIFKMLLIGLMGPISFGGDVGDDFNIDKSYPLYSENIFGPFYTDTYSYSSTISISIDKRIHATNCGLNIYMYDVGDTAYYTNEIYHKNFRSRLGENVIDYTLSFPNGFIYPSGVMFYFEIYTNYGDVIGSYECKIKTSPKDIDISTIKDNKAKYSDFAVIIGRFSSLSEEYDFSNINDYFTNDRYYRLDLSNLYFSYKSSSNYSYQKAYLSFIDYENIFPYIPSDSSNHKVIDLKINRDNNLYKFSYLNKFYVNPNTLDISMEIKSGYILSDYFYLPRGKQDKFDGYIFRLNILNSGVQKLNFYYDISFYVGYSVIGDCISSDYCVIGGIRA